MNLDAKYRHPNSFRAGRRGNDIPRGGSQRNPNAGPDGSNPGSQQNRRGGKQQQQPMNRPQPQPTPPPTQRQPSSATSQAPAESKSQDVRLPQRAEPPVTSDGFDVSDVREMLVRGVDTSAQLYKSQGGGETAKQGNPWGMKRKHRQLTFINDVLHATQRTGHCSSLLISLERPNC
jgi:hypothetical protein